MSIVTRPLPVCFELVDLVRFNRQRYPYALISSAYQADNKTSPLKANVGRYDIVFACPQESLQLSANRQLYYTDEAGNRLNKKVTGKTFFDELTGLCAQYKTHINTEDKSGIPFYGGWFVYLAYEMAAEIETRLVFPQSKTRLPLALASRIPAAIIRDRISNHCQIVVERTALELLDKIETDCLEIIRQQTQPPVLSINSQSASQPQLVAQNQFVESDENRYLLQVEKIKQYIYAGDIFQANLSRCWHAQLMQAMDDVALFSRLAEHNPSSFAALATFNDAAIISSSPERLVSMRNGFIETRPIAGTRPRSSDPHFDAAMAKELLSHPKELAEHIMLIDLERNDLGRVCIPGSIQVNELMALESWQHVHHIVSNIRGECQKDKSAVDVLKAVFPGGTITGCPKIRCMEILAEQEQEMRGAYTGSLGYINLDGDMDFNILIRTLVRECDHLFFRAGGGIVADSQGQHELEETRAKARGLLKIFDVSNSVI